MNNFSKNCENDDFQVIFRLLQLPKLILIYFLKVDEKFQWNKQKIKKHASPHPFLIRNSLHSWLNSHDKTYRVTKKWKNDIGKMAGENQ